VLRLITTSSYRLYSFPYDATAEQNYYKLFLPNDNEPHGYMLPEIVDRMPWTSNFDVQHSKRTVQVLDSSHGIDTENALISAFSEVVTACIERDLFHVLCRQHSEPFAIPGARYGNPVYIERFSAALFGVTSRGAHMVAYCKDDSGMMKVWIPRRSAHLYTYPGMLDTSVAGGVKAFQSPYTTILEEADEEASLSRHHIVQKMRCTGVISHMIITGEDFPGEKGLVIPDYIYTYDLELPKDVTPRPNDDEVSSFTLMSIRELKTALLRGDFKPDSAAVLVDFLIRHAFITPENEHDFVEINTRLHRRLPFRTGSSSCTWSSMKG
jgi:isopentenyldiphosphate isomerase